jgi:hypothetical protein
MSKKHTYEYIKNYFEDRAWQLTSLSYDGCMSKLLCVCPNSHPCSISFNNFRNGYRCPVCAGNKKFTHSFVKKYFENRGWQLLSSKYIDNRGLLRCICPKGHECLINFGNFKNKHSGCPTCSGKKKALYSTVKEYIESFGWTLTSLIYINSSGLLECRCPKGHLCHISFGSFKNAGTRCPICAGNIKFTYEEVKQLVEADGTTLRSSEYVNVGTPLDFMCPKGHLYSNTFSHFKNDGQRCPKCSNTGVSLVVNGKKYKVDGFDPLTRTIYEFLGDFWHGNPTRFIPEDINPKLKKSYGQLHKETFERIATLEAARYNVVYIWESDFKAGLAA